jgi:hypothetical protein
VRDGFGKGLDARSTLFLAEREMVVLNRMAQVNWLVGLVFTDRRDSAYRT